MMDGLIRPGMRMECEVLKHLASDRYLVNLSGREMVMQFSGNPGEEARIPVQVVEVRPDLVLARLLDSEGGLKEVLSGFRIPAADRGEAVRVVEILQTLAYPLNEENVRKLLSLRRLLGDDDLALSLFLKGVRPEEAARLVFVFGRDPVEALERIEKFIIKTSERAEKNDRSIITGPISTGSGGFLSGLLEAEGLALFRSGTGSEAFFAFLTRFRRICPEEDQEDVDLLLGRISLDRLKTVQTASYAVFFETVFWKDASGWHQAEVKAERRDADTVFRIGIRTVFGRIGPVEAEVIFRPDRKGPGRKESHIVFSGPGDADRYRSFFDGLGTDWIVSLSDSTGPGPESGPERKIWRKVDVVV